MDAAGIDEIIKEISEGNLDRQEKIYKYISKYPIAPIIAKLMSYEGNKFALYVCAMVHVKTHDPKNYNTAIKLLEKAVKKQFVPAYTVLAKLYKINKKSAAIKSKVVKLCQYGIDHNDINALFLMATLYQDGYGVEKNHKKATEFYKLAIEKGSDETLDSVAMECYDILTEDSKSDFPEAFNILKLCAEKGNMHATYNMAICYFCGYGTEQCMKTGIKYLCKSHKDIFHEDDVREKFLEDIARIDVLMDMYNEAIEQNSELQKELKKKDAYITELEFRPGGIKYEEAKCEFDNAKKLLK